MQEAFCYSVTRHFSIPKCYSVLENFIVLHETKVKIKSLSENNLIDSTYYESIQTATDEIL